jgi:hypothetical protein
MGPAAIESAATVAARASLPVALANDLAFEVDIVVSPVIT